MPDALPAVPPPTSIVVDIDKIPQTTGDFAQLKHLLAESVRKIKATKVLEIGTNVGDSTRVFSAVLQETQGKLITVDIAPPHENWPEKLPWPLKNIQFVTQDSLQVPWGNEFDLLFLDGDHHAEHVAKELDKFGIWVKNGGLILLHDVCHSEFGTGIMTVAIQWAVKQQVPITIYPYQHGLGVIDVNHPLSR